MKAKLSLVMVAESLGLTRGPRVQSPMSAQEVYEVALDTTDDTLEPMLADARALAPVLRDRVQETDELRRLPDETVADIDHLGILGVGAPRGVGGADLGPDAIFLLTFELA